MNSNQLARPVEQDRKIFRSPKQGPIPDSVLDSLLSEAEEILSKEILQRSPKQALGGIRLGYQIEQSDYSVESYWIGFGQNFCYEKLLKFTELPTDQEASREDSSSILSTKGSLADEVMGKLTVHIETVIRSQIPAEIDEANVHGWVFAHSLGYFRPISFMFNFPGFSSVFRPDTSILTISYIQGTTGNCCKKRGIRRGVLGYCDGRSCRENVL
jgi:hypothetical protein